MTAKDIANFDIPAAKKTDSIDAVLTWMEEFKVSHIPIIEGDQYIGLINENDLLDQTDGNALMETVANLADHELHIDANQHAFEVVNTIASEGITLLPVLGDNNKYLGSIGLSYLIGRLSEIGSYEGEGSILILELNVNDYSLSEIARIVESNDAKIISCYTTTHSDSTKLDVTIKINKTDVSGVIQTFERFEYNVVASFNTTNYYEDLKDRYDQFMRYLNT